MVLTENDIYNVVFKTIQQKPGEQIAKKLIKNTCKTIEAIVIEKHIDYVDTQEILDDVIACMNYYNDFIVEKNMNLPVIGDTYFSLAEITLNVLIGEILNERKEN